MKQFFWGCRAAKVATTICLVSIYAGIILPVFDWEGAHEASRPALIWSIFWIVVGVIALIALWCIRKMKRPEMARYFD